MKTVVFLLLLAASTITTVKSQQTSATQPVVNRSKKICIVGNVVKPQEILFERHLTVTEAIEQAGGIRPDKKDNKVLVISNMIGGSSRVIYLDLKAVKKKPYMDLDLQDLDIIEVLSRKPEKVREPFVGPCPWVPHKTTGTL